MRQPGLIRIALFTVLSAAHANIGLTNDGGDDSGYFELSLEELGRIPLVVTASGLEESGRETISAVTVISGVELRSMGARSVIDALHFVPGMTVTYGNSGQPIVGHRGMRSIFTDRILFMLNGHALNSPDNGSATRFHFATLPVENVQRIEVVRDPVSAIYGTTAFLAIVNIITETPTESAGTAISMGTEFEEGNDIGQRYNLKIGREFREGKGLALNLNLVDLGGLELFSSGDSFGRPGFADTEFERAEIQLSLELMNVTIQGRYMDWQSGGYFNASNVLAQGTRQRIRTGFIEAEATFELSEDASLTAVSYVDHQDGDNFFELFPAGSIPAGHPLEPWNGTGYLANPQLKTTSAGGEIRLELSRWQGHRLLFGVSGRYDSQHDIRYRANFNPQFLPQVQDVSREYNFSRSANRHLIAGYVQDIWQPLDRLRLMYGGRYDDYSDFGGHFSPRLGLAIDLIEGYRLKLMYTEAFAAPSFADQYIRNNPVATGNPNLDPETMSTLEVGLDGQITKGLNTRVTYFYNRSDDLIDLNPATAMIENSRKRTVHGIEIEARCQFSARSYIAANYTVSDSESEGSSTVPEAVDESGSATFNWSPFKKLNWNTGIFFQGNASRVGFDPRSSLERYAVVNSSLRIFEIIPNAEVQFTILNVLDKDYMYPSPVNTFEKDYPAPSRSYVINGQFRF